MAAKNIAVFGIYPDQLTAEDAVDSLKNSGFRSTDISVLFPDNQGSKDFAHEKHTKAPEGAVAGGSSGAVIGGALGWLAGIGALAIPGVGPFISGGPDHGFAWWHWCWWSDWRCDWSSHRPGDSGIRGKKIRRSHPAG